MKRRNFLKALGIAPVAAPAVAEEAMREFSMQAPMIGSGDGFTSGIGVPIDAEKNWMQQELKRFLGRSPEFLAWSRRQHRPDALDPNIASMKSVSMSAKIRMNRDRSFDRHQSREHQRILGGISGWFDY